MKKYVMLVLLSQVSLFGCVANRKDSVSLLLYPLENINFCTQASHFPPVAIVSTTDIRGGVISPEESLSINSYDPAIAVLFVKNNSRDKVKIYSPLTKKWLLHARYGFNEIVLPIAYKEFAFLPLHISDLKNIKKEDFEDSKKIELDPNEEFVYIIGLNELCSDMFVHLSELFVENILEDNKSRISNSLHFSDRFQGDLLNDYGVCTNYLQEIKYLTPSSENLKMKILLPMQLKESFLSQYVFVERNDSIGNGYFDKKYNIKYYYSCGLLCLENVSNKDIKIESFDSPSWKIVFEDKNKRKHSIKMIESKYKLKDPFRVIRAGEKLVILLSVGDCHFDIDGCFISVMYDDGNNIIESLPMHAEYDDANFVHESVNYCQ